MSQITFNAEAVLAAQAEAVYRSIADYYNGQPHIVPKANISEIQVQAGGYGAGTVVTFKRKLLFFGRLKRKTIVEPDPGRLLVELEEVAGSAPIMTSYRVIPVSKGRETYVEIITSIPHRKGFGGLMDRLFLPKRLRKMHYKELYLLEQHAKNIRIELAA